MKKCLLLLCLINRTWLYAQQENLSFNVQQQLEAASQKTGTDNEDEAYITRLLYLSKHPLNVNQADKEDLEELGLLNEIQINRFLEYRRLLGKLLSLYELQAVPGWSISTIQKILPYITVSDAVTAWERVKARWKGGEQRFLLRWARTPEKAEGYKSDTAGSSRYLGSPDKLYMRWTYKNKDLLDMGVLGEKDAGEQFLRGNKGGFDFYSFHLFATKIGLVKEVAVGDYTVSMGQGLIQWQGLAIGMGPGLVQVEKQSPVLHPYSSPGESSFYRGAGATVKKGDWELTGFYSARHIDANTQSGAAGVPEHITSLLQSGYHRTANELQTKGNVRQLTGGGVLSYSVRQLKLCLNGVQYSFSQPLLKDDQPYNLFAASGKRFANTSFSYSYSWRNLHVFGEWAVDKALHRAVLNGLLITPDPKVDFAVVQRGIDKKYQSLYANAFTQNTQPVNEQGIYTGITVRPSDLLTIEAYTDLYRFSWLKYRVDAPAFGKEYCLQLSYNPNKQVALVSRYRQEYKPLDAAGGDSVMQAVQLTQHSSWLTQLSVALNKSVTLQNRCEMSAFTDKQSDREQGYLLFSEVVYKPAGRPFSGSARLQYFQTDGYNSRLYAYENSVLYGFSIPAFFDKGLRYYCNMHLDVSRCLHKSNLHADCWLRWAQSVYAGKKTLGEGSDRINGNKKSELTMQLIITRN